MKKTKKAVFAKDIASVDVRCAPSKIFPVWEKFATRYSGRCAYAVCAPRVSVFTFDSDRLAMSFARQCRDAGLWAAAYPLQY
jgi:hypothetical protein